MESTNHKEHPKILVISNNPFSKTSNNGKTLASFFREFPSEDIAQLYFSSETPTVECYKKYYRISDTQVLKSLLSFNNAGSVVNISHNKQDTKSENESVKPSIGSMSKSNFFRILRDFIWKSNKWKSVELINWIEDFSPDIIFFCAGDTGFVYDIVSFVLEKSGAKLITYITDDYILPRRKTSPMWWIRRNAILKKMNIAVLRSDLFITISEQMRNTYRKIFNKDSIVALNITDSMIIKNNRCDNSSKKTINLIYAGGLHFQRYQTLNMLAEAINNYNNQSVDKKAFLSIYSTTRPTNKVLHKLNIKDASEFLGSLDTETLKIKLNESDIPVHVESFDLKSIESTRLSLSTKIPEYLSLGKPVLAIGPTEVASMNYLRDIAYCITNKNDINENLSKFLNNQKLRDNLSILSLDKYNSNHNSEEVGKKLKSEIIDTVKKGR